MVSGMGAQREGPQTCWGVVGMRICKNGLEFPGMKRAHGHASRGVVWFETEG